MANIGKHVHVYLQTKTAVTDLAGSRGYPGVLKGKIEATSYTYRVVSGNHGMHLRGFNAAAKSRVEISCYATTQLAAYALRDAIRIALMAARPITMDDNVVDYVAHVSGPIDEQDNPIDGNANGWRYRVIDDYHLFHGELIS